MPLEYPPGWECRATGDEDHPVAIVADGDPILTESEDQACALAWRIYAEGLADGHEPATHPAPVALVRALCCLVGGQRAAGRLLQCSERVVRKWCAGDSPASHAAVELLRMAAAGRWP